MIVGCLEKKRRMKNKKIQDIAPLLAGHFVDIEPDLGAVEYYNNLLTINLKE